jgi:plastocyanin
LYDVWVFVHLVGVLAFLVVHGVSMAVSFRIRTEREPRKVVALLELSASTVRLMYVSLGVILVAGIVAGALGHWWRYGWIWGGLILLLLTSLAMVGIASPYQRRVGLVARALAGGSGAVTQQQFDEIVTSGRPLTIAGIGFVGLAAIVYLMVFKPSLGFAPPTPLVVCLPSGPNVSVSAKGTAFDQDCLAVPQGQAFEVVFDNKDRLPHNVAIYRDSSASQTLFQGDVFTGPKTRTYRVSALTPGRYFFRCDVHPQQMQGAFIVGAASPGGFPSTNPPGSPSG